MKMYVIYDESGSLQPCSLWPPRSVHKNGLKEMYLRVIEARYVPRYQVDVAFNDGTHRVVDFGPFLKQARNPMFTKYRRLKEFKSFHIHDGDLMWGDYEMIFPITDLYRGNILKGEQEPAPSSPARCGRPAPFTKTD